MTTRLNSTMADFNLVNDESDTSSHNKCFASLLPQYLFKNDNLSLVRNNFTALHNNIRSL